MHASPPRWMCRERRPGELGQGAPEDACRSLDHRTSGHPPGACTTGVLLFAVHAARHSRPLACKVCRMGGWLVGWRQAEGLRLILQECDKPARVMHSALAR